MSTISFNAAKLQYVDSFTFVNTLFTFKISLLEKHPVETFWQTVQRGVRRCMQSRVKAVLSKLFHWEKSSQIMAALKKQAIPRHLQQ